MAHFPSGFAYDERPLGAMRSQFPIAQQIIPFLRIAGYDARIRSPWALRASRFAARRCEAENPTNQNGP
jgi:hypothetical protein